MVPVLTGDVSVCVNTVYRTTARTGNVEHTFQPIPALWQFFTQMRARKHTHTCTHTHTRWGFLVDLIIYIYQYVCMSKLVCCVFHGCWLKYSFSTAVVSVVFVSVVYWIACCQAWTLSKWKWPSQKPCIRLSGMKQSSIVLLVFYFKLCSPWCPADFASRPFLSLSTKSFPAHFTLAFSCHSHVTDFQGSPTVLVKRGRGRPRLSESSEHPSVLNHKVCPFERQPPTFSSLAMLCASKCTFICATDT